MILAKGAPEVISGCSTELDAAGKPHAFDPSGALQTARLFARDALAPLGFAVRELPADHSGLCPGMTGSGRVFCRDCRA